MATRTGRVYTWIMKRRATIRSGVLLAFLLSTLPLAGVERIVFEAPLVDRGDRVLSRLVDDILAQTRAMLPNASGGLLAADGEPASARYTLATVASTSGGTLTFIATLNVSPTARSPTPSCGLDRPVDDLPLLVARGIFARWRTFELRAPVDLVTARAGRRNFHQLARSDPRPYLYPWGLALRGDGTLVAALGAACLELDAAFRVVGEPGRALVDRGIANIAGGVSLSMAETVVLRPLQGRDLYRIPRGTAEAQKIPAGLDVVLARVYSLPDGTMLGRRSREGARRPSRQPARRSRSLSRWIASLYWQASSVAPDGTLWYWDPVIRGFRIFYGDGTLVRLPDPAGRPAGVARTRVVRRRLRRRCRGGLERHRPALPP